MAMNTTTYAVQNTPKNIHIDHFLNAVPDTQKLLFIDVNSCTLTWDPVEDASKYYLRLDNGDAIETTQTTHTFNSLWDAGRTTHFIDISAVNANGYEFLKTEELRIVNGNRALDTLNFSEPGLNRIFPEGFFGTAINFNYVKGMTHFEYTVTSNGDVLLEGNQATRNVIYLRESLFQETEVPITIHVEAKKGLNTLDVIEKELILDPSLDPGDYTLWQVNYSPIPAINGAGKLILQDNFPTSADTTLQLEGKIHIFDNNNLEVETYHFTRYPYADPKFDIDFQLDSGHYTVDIEAFATSNAASNESDQTVLYGETSFTLNVINENVPTLSDALLGCSAVSFEGSEDIYAINLGEKGLSGKWNIENIFGAVTTIEFGSVKGQSIEPDGETWYITDALCKSESFSGPRELKYKITYNDASEVDFVHIKGLSKTNTVNTISVSPQNISVDKVLENTAPNVKQIEILGADNAPLPLGNQAQLIDDEIFVPAESLLSAYDFDVWFNTNLQCLVAYKDNKALILQPGGSGNSNLFVYEPNQDNTSIGKRYIFSESTGVTLLNELGEYNTSLSAFETFFNIKLFVYADNPKKITYQFDPSTPVDISPINADFIGEPSESLYDTVINRFGVVLSRFE